MERPIGCIHGVICSESIRSTQLHLVSLEVSLVICAMFGRSLFVHLSLFFWPLCGLFFVNIRILITTLVSSNSS
jgi:hypothetical protein